uniref:Apple domain-containing protein n=1 Tax=Heterorhabditis bacteriophora TaxID=37862 RepID=A0A1I7XSR7_HETBA
MLLLKLVILLATTEDNQAIMNNEDGDSGNESDKRPAVLLFLCALNGRPHKRILNMSSREFSDMYITTLFYLGLIGPLTINAQNYRTVRPEDTTIISYSAYPLNINKESNIKTNLPEIEQIQYGKFAILYQKIIIQWTTHFASFKALPVLNARSDDGATADLKRQARHNLREITDSVNESSGTELPKPFIKLRMSPFNSVLFSTAPSLGYRPPPPPVRREIIMAPRCQYDTDKWALHPQSTITYATMFERSTGGSCEECLKHCAERQAAGVKTIHSIEVSTLHETVPVKDQKTTGGNGKSQVEDKEKLQMMRKEIPGINVHNQQIGDEVEAMVKHVMNEEKSIEKELNQLNREKKVAGQMEDQQAEKIDKDKKETKASEEGKHDQIKEAKKEITINGTKKSDNLKKTFLRYQHHIQAQQRRKNYKITLSTEAKLSSTISDIKETTISSIEISSKVDSVDAESSEENSKKITKNIKEKRTVENEMENKEEYRLHSMGSFEDSDYNDDIMLEAYNAVYEGSKSNDTFESTKISRDESIEISSEISHESVCASEDKVVMVEFPSATRQPFKADIKKIEVATTEQCTDLCAKDDDCSAAIYSTNSCELSSTLARHSRPELYPSLNCSYIEKACVPQTVIRGYSTHMIGVADHILAGHVEEVEDALSLEQCISSCLRARSRHGFHCLSAMWYPMDRSQNCLLNSESRKSKPRLFIPEEVGLHMVYFELSDTNNSKQLFDKSIRRLDTPDISSHWTFWSSCDGKSENAMRFRYMKCSEKYDIRQCPKETAFCGSSKLKGPLVRKIESPKI